MTRLVKSQRNYPVDGLESSSSQQPDPPSAGIGRCIETWIVPWGLARHFFFDSWGMHVFNAIKEFFARLAFWRKRPVSRKWKRAEDKPKSKPTARGIPLHNVNGRIVAKQTDGSRPLTARNARRLAKKAEGKSNVRR